MWNYNVHISLFQISGDTGSVTPNGASTITWVGGTGIGTSVSGDDLTIAIDSTVVTLDGSQTLTNKTIDGSQLVDSSVSNAKLANSSLTLAGDSGTQTLDLGDTSTFNGGNGIAGQYDQSWQYKLKDCDTLSISDFQSLY